MHRLALALATLVTACAGAAPAAQAPATTPPPSPVPAPAPPAFQPASFTVQVSGSGRPVIFIPGLGCPGSVWDGTVAHLHAQAHVLTLAGFAGEPALAPGAPLTTTVVDELARYIRDRHLDHPVIIGHSLGGTIAYELAANAPELVGPVVVIDEPAHIGMPAAQARQMRDGIRAESDAAFARHTRDMFEPMFRDRAEAEPVIAAVLRSDHRAFADALYEVFTTSLDRRLPAITAPVLVLLADESFAGEIARQVAAIPHHEVHVIPHTRHFVMLDDPRATFAALDAFLAAHP